MSDLTLYLARGTCAMAVDIALREANADYKVHLVDFLQREQYSPEFLAITPKGRVPTLMTEHGVLTETPALLFYVAQRFPEANLAPLSDPFLLARMQEVNCYLASTVHVAHAHGPRAYRWADDPHAITSMKSKVKENMHDCFMQIEKHYLVGPWVLGDRFSVTDIYLYVVASWLKGDGVDIAEFPKVAEHSRAMLGRPSVQAALLF